MAEQRLKPQMLMGDKSGKSKLSLVLYACTDLCDDRFCIPAFLVHAESVTSANQVLLHG